MREALKAVLESAHTQIREAHGAIQQGDPQRAQAHALIALGELMLAVAHDVLDEDEDLPGV